VSDKEYYIQKLQGFEALLQEHLKNNLPQTSFEDICKEFERLLSDLASSPQKLGKENLVYLERPLALLKELESKLSTRMDEWVLMRNFTG